MSEIGLMSPPPPAQIARHHYRRQRGVVGCRLCGKPLSDPRHWEAEQRPGGDA